MSERLDFNACWEECMKRAYLPSGVLATNKYEIKESAEAFFNLGANYKNRDKEIDQLKAQIDKMKNCENCKHKTIKFIAVACRLTDSTNMPDYVCDKWEMMKCI